MKVWLQLISLSFFEGMENQESVIALAKVPGYDVSPSPTGGTLIDFPMSQVLRFSISQNQ
jgi:hypothetical protein